MQDLIDDIIVWQRQTFPNTTVRGTLRHLGQEIIEFLAAYSMTIPAMSFEGTKLLEIMQTKLNKELKSDYTAKNVPDELADIQILLIQLADTCGVNLAQALEAKMKQNNIRRWTLDENEIAQHIDE